MPLEASSRAARGVLRRRPSQAIVKLRRRGVVPDTDAARQAEAIEAARDPGVAGSPAAEAGAIRRLARERAAFVEAGERLQRSAGAATSAEERAMLLDMARDVVAFAASLPTPVSERAEIIAKVRRADELRARSRQAKGLDLER